MAVPFFRLVPGAVCVPRSAMEVFYFMRLREHIEQDVIASAVSLDEFLRSNVGPTADWPLDLVANSEPVALDLALLLSRLQDSCREYRALPA